MNSLQRVAIRICAPVPRERTAVWARREILPFFGRKEILAFRVSPANISPNQMKRQLTPEPPPQINAEKGCLHVLSTSLGQPSERNHIHCALKRIEHWFASLTLGRRFE